MTLKFLGYDLSQQAGFDMAKKAVHSHIDEMVADKLSPDGMFKKAASKLYDDIGDFSKDLAAQAARGVTLNPRCLQEIEYAERIYAISTATTHAGAAFKEANIIRGKAMDGAQPSKAQRLKTEFVIGLEDRPRGRIIVNAHFGQGPL